MFHFGKKPDISEMTHEELLSALEKIKQDKMSFGRKLGRLAAGALGVAGGLKFLTIMGTTAVTFAVIPVLVLPALALLGACAASGVSLYAALTDTPAKTKQNKAREITRELNRRYEATLPKKEKTVPSPAPVEKVQTATIASETKTLRDVPDQSMIANRKAEELAQVRDLHTREFSALFYQLTSPRDQNGSPLFSLENIEHEAPVGGSPKILTSIYLGGTEVAAALWRQADDRLRTQFNRDARPDAERQVDYTALCAVPQFRITTSPQGVEISYTRPGKYGRENKRFPKKTGVPTADDFAEARKALGEWLAINAPEHLEQKKSATAHLQKPPAP